MATKIDIISGFLGAGKTTLIKRLITDVYAGERLVLIENEFGEIGIDGGFLADAGIQINEMNSGCICCSLVGDFSAALAKVLDEYHPDRILIEPSGVGKLSDVIRAVKGASGDAELNSFTTVVDAGKCKMYMKNFGEFFNDQVENAGCVILSHADIASEKKIAEAVELIKAHNPTAVIVAAPVDSLTGDQLREAMERRDTLEAELERLAHEHEHHHHHHHGEDCDCGCHEHEHHHHHHHGEDCDCGCHEHEHHHHHHHGEGCDCGCHEDEHHHHHHHGEDCDCGCHEHEHHHHHHHADEVFTSCGAETGKKFNAEALRAALNALCDEGSYGVVLRAKGIVACECGEWLHFDYVPGEADVRKGAPAVIGRVCVIGAGLKVDALNALLGVELK